MRYLIVLMTLILLGTSCGLTKDDFFVPGKRS